MKQYIPLVFLIYLFSCNLDTNKDLQIDQSFEGEEAYWVSKTLDEHFYLAFYNASIFSNTTFTDSLPGCPTVSIGEDNLTVTLDYDSPKCEAGSTDRKGKLMLKYSSRSSNVDDSIKISYDNYQYDNSKFEGHRLFHVVQKRSSSMILEESSDTLLLKDENESSTRLMLDMEHQGKILSQVLTEISSTGTMKGRNWGGNQLEAVITTPKIINTQCLSLLKFRPVSGEESWTIQRTGESPVTHLLTYSNAEGCDTKTTIKLSEGVIMIKQP
ncbi:hypothetical protein [Cyclobacterium qasimii]|uniref:S-adenosyl-L-homocysteine hydrolase n=2 Tax=Cyclobacterium qasimii TaxID=1350429 RepID=S7WZM3_9BACT|nr:hypothetical protein [Cyclobacterium qasimii]EPR69358.1 S-adenosyl-L-homocysteine hydrolase [Cyclobacterium qasimii M12-11B]GEO22846.1 hypothetical protein CQA01_33800 [Cyclobacterium qasimii]